MKIYLKEYWSSFCHGNSPGNHNQQTLIFGCECLPLPHILTTPSSPKELSIQTSRKTVYRNWSIERPSDRGTDVYKPVWELYIRLIFRCFWFLEIFSGKRRNSISRNFLQRRQANKNCHCIYFQNFYECPKSIFYSCLIWLSPRIENHQIHIMHLKGQVLWKGALSREMIGNEKKIIVLAQLSTRRIRKVRWTNSILKALSVVCLLLDPCLNTIEILNA